MDRSEFLKGLALTPFASLINYEGEKPEPRNKEAGKHLDALKEAFDNQEPIKLFGIEFFMTEINIQSSGAFPSGRRDIRLILTSTGRTYGETEDLD